MFRSHILVCGGTGCTSNNSIKIYEALVHRIYEEGLEKEVHVTQTGCFGLCALGPIMIVYPEGAFYSQVKVEDVDEIVSRSSGADDYVTKPYNPTLLLLRIETVLRRTGGQPREEELSYRGMRLNVLRSSIFYKGEEHVLSHNEMTILHCLVKNRGRIVSRDELMDYLWDNSEFVDDNTLTVNINRLRKRLDGIGMGDVIETRRRQGYILM